VTNIGGAALENIEVTDNKLGKISCQQTILAPSESMECTASAEALDLSSGTFTGVTGNCAGIASSRMYQNIGKVTAETAGGATVEDDDKSHYCNPRKDLIFRSSFEQEGS